jgi:hypothetical protein
VRLGQPRGALDLGVARAPAPVGDVLAHRAVEEEDVLADEPDGAAQVVEPELADVDAVEGDLALLDLVEPQQQLDSVLFPEPVEPTTPTVQPAGTESETSRSTGARRGRRR